MINTKVIRDSVVSRINGLTVNSVTFVTDTNLFESKVTPNINASLPIISVYTPTQTAESLDHRNPQFKRDIDIQIEVNVASATDWSDQVDDIMVAIKTALYEDATWLDLFEDTPSYDETHQVEDGGEQPLALGQLTITTTIVEIINANR